MTRLPVDDGVESASTESQGLAAKEKRRGSRSDGDSWPAACSMAVSSNGSYGRISWLIVLDEEGRMRPWLTGV